MGGVLFVCCQVEFEPSMLLCDSGNHKFVISMEASEGELPFFVGGGSEGLGQPFALDELLEPLENRFGTIFLIDQAAFFDPTLPVREPPIIDRDDGRMTEALPVDLLYKISLRLRRSHPFVETALDLLFPRWLMQFGNVNGYVQALIHLQRVPHFMRPQPMVERMHLQPQSGNRNLPGFFYSTIKS